MLSLFLADPSLNFTDTQLRDILLSIFIAGWLVRPCGALAKAWMDGVGLRYLLKVLVVRWYCYKVVWSVVWYRVPRRRVFSSPTTDGRSCAAIVLYITPRLTV